jgi:hypothetical protein
MVFEFIGVQSFLGAFFYFLERPFLHNFSGLASESFNFAIEKIKKNSNLSNHDLSESQTQFPRHKGSVMKDSEGQETIHKVRFVRSHKKRSLWTWIFPLAGILAIIILLPRLLALLEG